MGRPFTTPVSQPSRAAGRPRRLAKLVGRFGLLTVIKGMGANVGARPGSITTVREPSTRPGTPGGWYLTAEEVAVRLGVLPSWVEKAARANRIPHVRVGRYRRFRWPDIEAWLENQRSDA
jgi:excisionase family DNA binding protein